MFQTLHIWINLNRSDTAEVLSRVCALFRLLLMNSFRAICSFHVYVSHTEVKMTDAAGTHSAATQHFTFCYSLCTDF